MSIDAVAWAFTVPDLKTSEKIALVGLANFADEFGVCYPRQETLSEMCSVADRTLRNALTELERRQIIGRLDRRRADGSRRSDVYLLVAYSRRKTITETTDHAVLSTQDIVEMRKRWDTKWQDLPVDDPDLFASEQPADSAKPTGKSCQTNRQIRPDQPAEFAGIYSIEPSKGIDEEARASASSFSEFVLEICEAVGHPELIERSFWKLEAENGFFITAWRGLGLSDEAILEAARSHASDMPEPPNGPKGLQRAMERKAKPTASTKTSARGRRTVTERKYTPLQERVAYFSKLLASGRYVAPTTITSTMRAALISGGHVTEEELRRRGL